MLASRQPLSPLVPPVGQRGRYKPESEVPRLPGAAARWSSSCSQCPLTVVLFHTEARPLRGAGATQREVRLPGAPWLLLPNPPHPTAWSSFPSTTPAEPQATGDTHCGRHSQESSPGPGNAWKLVNDRKGSILGGLSRTAYTSCPTRGCDFHPSGSKGTHGLEPHPSAGPVGRQGLLLGGPRARAPGVLNYRVHQTPGTLAECIFQNFPFSGVSPGPWK